MNPNHFLRLAVILAASLLAHALIAGPVLLSSTRTVSASGNDSLGHSWSQSFTSTTFDDFNQTASANGASARMTSTLSTDAFNYSVRASGYLDGRDLPPNPGGPSNWTSDQASSLFTTTFRLDVPTYVTFTGHRDNETLGGSISFALTSSTGPVSLTWRDYPYFNYLDQTLLLGPDTYTLTGQTQLGYVVSGSSYDGGTQLLDMNVRFSTPDGASTAGLLLFGAFGMAVLARRHGRTRSREGSASADRAG